MLAITNAEPANDTLTVNTVGGDDLVSASGLAATSLQPDAERRHRDDILVGSQGTTRSTASRNDDFRPATATTRSTAGWISTRATAAPGIDVGLNCETSTNIP